MNMAFWNRKKQEPESNKLTGAARADAWFGLTRFDGWTSALGGFGTTKDKTALVGIQSSVLPDQICEDIWRSDDLAGRVVEVPPKESLRQGFGINVGDKVLAEDIIAMGEDLLLLPKFLEAKYWERAYGGSALYPVINDGSADLSQPLNLNRIPRIECVHTIQKRELTPNQWYTNITDKKYGRPKTYWFSPLTLGGTAGFGQLEIHESRLILFYGRQVSRAQSQTNGWGDSIFNRIWKVLSGYNISWNATTVLLHEFAQASFKMKGLAALMAADKDDVIKTRIRAVELARSTINAVLMDAEEEYERKQTPVSGLAELLDRFATRLAAAADMPLTLLMGQSPAGLNATGESDIRFFYDRIKADQDLGLKDQLEYMMKLIMLSLMGPTNGNEPKQWSIEFKPLWQPSEKEKAETRKIYADTDAVYMQWGVYDPEEVAKNRFGGDTFGTEMAIDFKERERLNAGTDDNDIEVVEGEIIEGDEAKQLAAGTQENVAATAMNGAQVTSLMDVVTRVSNQEISRESGLAILRIAFRVTNKEAEEILGPEDFEPVKPEPPLALNGAIEGENQEEDQPPEEDTEEEDKPDEKEEEDV